MRARYAAMSKSSNLLGILSTQSSTVTRAMRFPFPVLLLQKSWLRRVDQRASDRRSSPYTFMNALANRQFSLVIPLDIAERRHPTRVYDPVCPPTRVL